VLRCMRGIINMLYADVSYFDFAVVTVNINRFASEFSVHHSVLMQIQKTSKHFMTPLLDYF
jgi:hypothetical protein